jgi:GntR family transcriptional regulator/MocR family aminotransferase
MSAIGVGVLDRDDLSPRVPPALDQLAFARFVESGAYDRHLRASRRRYRARRDTLVGAIARHLPDCPISGVAAGLHLLLHLPAVVDPTSVVARAAVRDVRVGDLDTYRVRPDPLHPALVIGYGDLDDGVIEAGVIELAAAVAE